MSNAVVYWNSWWKWLFRTCIERMRHHVDVQDSRTLTNIAPLALFFLLVMSACDRAVDVSGTVKNSRGESIPDAVVTLTVGAKVHQARSASDGTFLVGFAHVPRNSDMTLSVVKAGYETSVTQIRSSRNSETVNVVLRSAQSRSNEAKSRRTVKGLPRYMIDIPQEIPDELIISGAPHTARTVDCFRSFTGENSMVDVVRRCGIPDEHQGSGIFIFVYDMDDGSLVAVGTPDLKRLFYVDHLVGKTGESLLRKNAKRQ